MLSTGAGAPHLKPEGRSLPMLHVREIIILLLLLLILSYICCRDKSGPLTTYRYDIQALGGRKLPTPEYGPLTIYKHDI